MPKKLIDRDKAFEIYYDAGAVRSLPKLYHTLIERYPPDTTSSSHNRPTTITPSQRTLGVWSKRDHWQDRILLRDNAVREGLQEASTAVVVEAKIKELQQLDTAYSEIESVKPLIVNALNSKYAASIVPETTQDVTALYNALSRLDTVQVKIVETARKIRGEADKVEVSGTLKHGISIETMLKDYETEQKR
jgi:hypothetical protein